jgi:hypothetical protein
MLQFPVNFFSVQAAGLFAVVAAPILACSQAFVFLPDLLTSVQLVSKNRIKIKREKIFHFLQHFRNMRCQTVRKNKF